jgi:hypothetical protein
LAFEEVIAEPPSQANPALVLNQDNLREERPDFRHVTTPRVNRRFTRHTNSHPR